MKQKLLLSFCLCLALFFQAIAQEKSVSGTVTDGDTGEPLPGVSIVVKNTSTGTVTDINGKFTILASEGVTLVFSAVGLGTREILVGPEAVIDVKMLTSTKELGEVVVVGYGVQEKRDVTGSISQVKGSDISSLSVQSFEQGLVGRASGVNITTPNGVLGNAPIIRVRGVNSISSSSEPLIVIDGLPVSSGVQNFSFVINNALGDLNPNDIESYEILKDASASAIYGSRAANGVILITTKKGKQGKAIVNYDTWIGWTEAFRKFDILNAEEYNLMKNEGYSNWLAGGNAAVNGRTAEQGIAQSIEDANGNLVDTDWYDVAYRTGFQQNHSLSVSGASDKTQYFFSVGYTDQDGMLRNNNFRRYTTRMNISHKINKWLSVGAQVQYTNSRTQSPNTGATGAFATSGLGRIPIVLPPNVPVYNEDGSYNIDAGNNRTGVGNNAPNAIGLNFPNPQVELDKNRAFSESNRILGNIYLNWEPISGLSLRSTIGLDNLYTEDTDFRTRLHGDGFSNGGQVFNRFARGRLFNWQNTINYQKTFAQKHSLGILAGTELQETAQDNWGASRQGIADDFFTSYQGNFTVNNPPSGNFQTENNLISYLARLNYSFADKYLFAFNFRRDGLSALSKDNKWGNFFGVSGGWRISEEGFFKNLGIGFISDFKLRASWGQVGNAFLPTNFGSLNLFSSGLNGTVPTWAISQIGNSALQWESSTKFDVGFDASFFNNRISLEFAYYSNDLEDLILNNPQPPSKGIPGNAILANVAQMRNRGIEITINATILDKNNFKWNAGFNITTNKNEVLALNETDSDITSSTGGLELTNITRVGESIGSIFAVEWVGVNPENGRAMFRNRNGDVVQYDHSAPAASRWTLVSDGTVASNPSTDRIIAGNTIPKWFGGLNNTFTYKGFELNIFLQFSGGNKIYNGTRAGLLDQRMWNNSTEVLNRWTTAGQQTDVPRVVYSDNISNGSAFAITRNVEKGDFLRARNISLAYTFRQPFIQKAGLGSVRLYAQVQNAFIITDYSGADPEISTNGQAQGSLANLAPGVDRNSTPQARTYSLGLNLTF